MKKRCFLFLGMFFLAGVGEVWALPPLPHTLWGTVKKNGSNPLDGTQVTAWIGGVQFAYTATSTSGSDSVYTFNVPGDDPGTPGKEGGVNGEVVSFKIGSDPAKQTAVFSSGTTTALDLSFDAQYTLTINIVGSGSVAKNPNKSAYNQGEQVTLTATPGSGFNFSSWSGDASGTLNPVTVTMSGNKTVTANFTAIPETVSIPNKPSGPGSGAAGTGYAFSAGGSTSNLGHTVEYQFDWKGDGTDLSPWGSSTQSKTWASAADYQVRARARCAIHTAIVSGWSTFLTVSITQAAVPCTITTVPVGLQVTIDGATYTAPKTFNWIPGSSHPVSVTSPLSGGQGTQYLFGSWSDGGALSHTITAPASSATLTANFTTQYTLTTSANPSAGGTVAPSGVNWYNSGQSVPLSATVIGGYGFTGWTGDLASPNMTTSITMSGPKNVAANFSQNQYTLTVILNPSGSGSVSRNPNKATYLVGEQVTLTATPGSGYNFSNWSGDAGGTLNPVTVTMSGNKTVTATFTQIPVQYTLTVNTVGSGAVSKSPNKSTYTQGEQVTLAATPGSGYNFGSWSGDLSGSTNPVMIPMDGSKNVTALFVTAGSLVISPADGLSASGTQGGPFSPNGKTYTIENQGGMAIHWKATRTQNWIDLSSVSGDLAPGAWTSVTVSINASGNSISAGSYSDSVAFENSTNGSGNTTRSVLLKVNVPTRTYTVTTSIAGLDLAVDDVSYPAPQTFEWVQGSSHKLSASSLQKVSGGNRYAFSSWSDGGSETHTINASSATLTYTANYKMQNKLKVTIVPPGAGTSNMDSKKGQKTLSLTSGSTGEEWCDSDDMVTLAAAANPGYSFSNWTGDLTGKTNPASLTMSSPKEVVANFTVVAETVSTPDTPGGPMSGSVGGSYAFGTGGAASSLNDPVEYQFDWKGNGTDLSPWGSSTQSKTWTSAADYQVRARARCATHPDVVSGWSSGLPVSISNPNGTYTVATDPAGLQITVDGVTLTAPQTFSWSPGSAHDLSVSSPQSGALGARYVFASWSNGEAKAHSIVTPSTSAVYTAKFTTEFSLTTSIDPSTAGTVDPSGTNWFQKGKTVTISVSANPGFSFSGWSGDLSGSINPSSILMEGPKSLKANFTSTSNSCQLTVEVNSAGNGTVVKAPEKSTYECGEQVVLNAKPNSGYTFKNWSGDLTGEINPATLTLSGAVRVVANFDFAGSLEVTPSEGLSGSGIQGGPITPSGQTFVLKNHSGASLKWKVSQKPQWVNLSPQSGALTSGERVEVSVSFSSNVNKFKPGSYSETILFSAGTNGDSGISRPITLSISPAIKKYTVKTDPDGLQVAVDGNVYTAPQTFEWQVGSSHALIAPPLQPGSPGTQYLFSSWSNRKPQSQTIVAPSSDATYTAVYKTMHALTTSAEPNEGGVVTPAGINWIAHGKKVSVTVKPDAEYQFLNWSGDLSGSSNPISFVMDGPIDLTANLGAIATPPTQTDSPLIGALESPSEGKRVLGIKTIYGWALDREGISRIRLLIDEEYVCDIPYGGLREELKETYPGYPNAEKGGFALVWNYSSLSPGPHYVQIEVKNLKGDILVLSANISIPELPGEIINEVNPGELLIPGVSLTVDGKTRVYNLRLGWSDESQAFEIIEIYPQ
jgi:uncharacterized repeat protein (TIGR02543 family)